MRENKITMSSRGVRGTTKKIDGINDCLKKRIELLNLMCVYHAPYIFFIMLITIFIVFAFIKSKNKFIFKCHTQKKNKQTNFNA